MRGWLWAGRASCVCGCCPGRFGRLRWCGDVKHQGSTRPPPPIEQSLIVFEGVSRFYGEVLGVNRVSLSIPPGITSLVGPNGSGKTTLMNLVTGLVRPTRGSTHVLGISPQDPERLFRLLGYSTQFDSFPKGLTGFQFVYSFLRLFGKEHAECETLAWKSIERVNMVEAAN